MSILFISPLGPADEWVTPTGLFFTFPDGTTSSSVVANEQPHGTGGPPGDWSVRVTPPDGWDLDPSQSSPLRVVMPPDTVIEIVVRLLPQEAL